MNPIRFGTAGVRGVFGKTVFVPDFLKLVLSVVVVTGGKKFVFGWDSRKMSSLIAHSAISIPLSLGSKALSVGMAPTPVTAFSTRNVGAAAGFSITASHNPPEFAGIKVFDKDGMELQRETERIVEDSIESAINHELDFQGDYETLDAINSYIEKLLEFVGRPKRRLRILVECANGPGCFVTPLILSRLGHQVMTLNCQVSWRFPARNPEPTPSNLSELSSVVKQLKLDVAFVHDGDADRLVLISPSGEILPHSVASILLLRSLELSSGTIVLSENTSNDVEDAAVEAGLKVVRTKIGKTFTELRNGAILSMEPSKAAYGRWGYWEDGIFAAVVIANILASSNSVLEKTVGNIRWNYTQLNIQGATDIEQLEPKVLESLNKYGVEEVRRVDGIKFVLRDGSWLMIRRSGTEPKLRIYCESRDKTILRKIVKLVASCVEGGK